MDINNVKVYGLKEAIKKSGYPKTTNIEDRKLSLDDIDRMKKLANAKNGSGHDCALKGIEVHFDITAPQYFWLQFQRYHYADKKDPRNTDIVSSQSKMHRITKMDIGKQCNEYVDGRIINILNNLIGDYNLNQPKEQKKWCFQKIISNCPMGLELTAGITTNYLQLKSMYHQRKNHKLKEWTIFCNMIEQLPFSGFITGEYKTDYTDLDNYIEVEVDNHLD